MSWSPSVRLSLGLVLVTSCILLVGDLAGLTPGRSGAILEARRQLSETLAIQYARDAQSGDWGAIRSSMQQLLERNESLLSMALRSAQGQLLVQMGDHASHWKPRRDGKSTPTHTLVPIYRGSHLWGQVELAFRPIGSTGLMGLWYNPIGRLLLFVGLAGFTAYLIFLRRTLKHLDPSAVIPARVAAVLDTLAEGVLLLDGDERIVLANAAAVDRLGRRAEKLIGLRPSSFPWHTAKGTKLNSTTVPWRRALRTGERSSGTPMALTTSDDARLSFMVSSAPIVDEDGARRGALVTLDDVTELEEKKEALERVLEDLRKSQDEIRMQNDELTVLATLDPLTGCLNRRSFMERLEREFQSALRGEVRIHCLMADIDHFKRVNDDHGHNMGDRVIEVVAAVLGSRLRGTDAISRWGGEEFCILLLNREWDEAQAEAELARRRVEQTDNDAASLPDELQLSVSLGVASLDSQPGSPLELIEHADQALYASKQRGRNRVTVFGPDVRGYDEEESMSYYGPERRRQGSND